MGFAHSAVRELMVSISVVTVGSLPSSAPSGAGTVFSTSIRMGQEMKSEYFLTSCRIFHGAV